VRDFAERKWKSNGGWTARTGCASVAAICGCATVRNRRRARQVLPAYGLQDLPQIPFPEKTKVHPPTIPGGHFNMAENRTFLLCVDSIDFADEVLLPPAKYLVVKNLLSASKMNSHRSSQKEAR
jgi:hypothetical protein